MISRAQITKRASEDGVDARVVERDYVLAHVVALISAHDTHAALDSLAEVPHFDEVERRVRRALRKAQLL